MKKIFILICSVSSISVFSQITYPGTPTVGASQIVYDYSVDKCNTIDIPDAPARAFRDAAGKINLIASHYTSWRMTGNSFTNLTKDCTPVMTSHQDSDPSKFNDNEWISSTYTNDGINIHALIHDEFVPCGNWQTCWYNAITYASSADSGKTYTHITAPGNLVAASPYQSPYPTTHAPFGIFGGSNIIKKNGYYYKMVGLEAHLLQEWGVGIIRTNNLSDPTSWRGWDGTGYNVQFVNPYTQSGYNIADKILAPVSRVQIGKMCSSLTYNTYFGKYMVVDFTNGEVNGVTVPGFFYALSDDLIHWSAERLILQTASTWAVGGSLYPSIIDHNDTTRNFEQAGQSCYLYYTKWNSGTYDRDLVRIPVTFNKEIVSSLVVNSTGDAVDKTPGDGICLTSGGVCTLRAAIEESNFRPPYDGYDTLALPVTFNISGTGVKTIIPSTFLPEIFYPLSIDGYTQTGASANTTNFNQGLNTVLTIAIDGNQGGGVFAFHSGNNLIKGLAIINGNIDFLYEPGYSKSRNNNMVNGCFIGMETDGTTPSQSAININNQNGNIIGGTTNASRNLIGGGVIIEKSENNEIIGNYIGTTMSGTFSSATLANGIQIGDSSAYNNIGGNNFSDRNLISGGNVGVSFFGAHNHDNYVTGNYIGVANDGISALGNNRSGILLSDSTNNNSIMNNVIADNSVDEAGIWIDNAYNNIIRSNFIGTDSSRTATIGNGDPGTFSAGIMLLNGSANNMIGGSIANEGNVIVNNNSFGISLYAGTGEGNAMLSNLIYNNVEMAIDLSADFSPDGNDNLDSDTGPNGSQNYPVLSEAYVTSTAISLLGTFNSKVNSSYTIQYYYNTACDPSGNGEGELLIGSQGITTNSSGNATINAQFNVAVPEGSFITATATDASNNTSEFSVCKIVESISIPTITAGSSLTFCEGGSVILTSSTAESYLWSNGATTQSTTIDSSGSYIVTTDTVGLTINSAPTTVNVYPLPTINVNGIVTICNGESTTLTASGADIYIWTSGPSTADYFVSPTSNTTYTVTGTNTTTTCSDTAIQLVTVQTCTNIIENSSNDIEVYPNPTNGIFNIAIKNAVFNKLSVSVKDILGKEVFSIIDNSKHKRTVYNKQIDLGDLAKGIYYINLSLGTELSFKKIIVLE